MIKEQENRKWSFVDSSLITRSSLEFNALPKDTSQLVDQVEDRTNNTRVREEATAQAVKFPGENLFSLQEIVNRNYLFIDMSISSIFLDLFILVCASRPTLI